MQKLISLCSQRSEEYDQETPQSQTTDQPTEPQGIVTKQKQQSQDTMSRKTIRVM